MKSQVSELARVARYLGALCRRKLTGELTLSDDTQQWKFYFSGGFMLYAVRETHRVRRWVRCIKHNYPSFSNLDMVISGDRCWEYQTLYRLLTQELLTSSQAKAILKETLEECLFPLINTSNLKIAWKAIDANSINTSPYLGLSPEEVRQTLKTIYQLYHQLQQMGLSYIFPEMTPVTKSSNLQQRFASESSLNLVAHMDGQVTIWDLMIIAKQPLNVISRLLHYLVQQDEIKLEIVPDLVLAPSAIEPSGSPPPDAKKTTYQPLIACIDDSPTVGKVMEEFLRSSGYRLVYIQNPLLGIVTLSEEIPDLIFIDIIMPDTNGYNLCQFLRNSETFKDVSIVIMTSGDGMINRTRAMLAGAKDFLGKPFTQDDVLKIVQRYVER